MFKNLLKNKYFKAILYLIGLALIALWLEIPLIVVLSVFLIILWLGYIYLAIKNSAFLAPKEKKIAHLCLFSLATLALSSVRGFKEILTLLVPMASRGDIAILIWFKYGKSFLATASAYTALSTIGVILIYVTADLIKSHTSPHIPKILNPIFSPLKNWKIIQFIKNLYQKIKNWMGSYKASLTSWISGKKLIWIFLIYLIPIPLPYLPTIIIVTVRYRDIKHGLWPLLIASLFKNLIFVWLIWQGLIHL